MSAGPGMVVYGKHPDMGDFLSHGLDDVRETTLSRWLDGVRDAVKTRAGDAWETTWDLAPPLRFWIGGAILDVPMAGVLAASRDRIGRRYPLIAAFAGHVVPCPMEEGFDPALYEAIWDRLGFADPRDGSEPFAAALDPWRPGPDAAEPSGPAAARAWPGTPWRPGGVAQVIAYREDGLLDPMFEESFADDLRHAQQGRSHWWHPALPDRDVGWLATGGLPDADQIWWLLTGRARLPAPEEDGLPPGPDDRRGTEEGEAR
ncbi:MAG: type VI secretion system-associated protein TagF [Shimia sp.]